MKFTLERESNNCLPFLDIYIIKNNNELVIKWYEKSFSFDRL